MASGVTWNEDYADRNSDVAKAGAANSLTLVQYLATLPAEVTPGDKFNYNTGETNLVGEILRAAIGNNATSYVERKIWQPFGMEADATWVLGEANGAELGGCCISATLRDYARLGLFALNGGVLPDGTETLPKDWMKASTQPSKGFDGYGYLWWLFGEGRYAAQGIFGQMIFINPKSNIVIAMHSNAETAVGSEYDKHSDAITLALDAYLAR
jgi:CubicO group peptidase (beta-lactamase class C family)